MSLNAWLSIMPVINPPICANHATPPVVSIPSVPIPFVNWLKNQKPKIDQNTWRYIVNDWSPNQLPNLFSYLFCLSRKDRVELQLFFACFVAKLSSQAYQDNSLHIVGYNLIIPYKQAKRLMSLIKYRLWKKICGWT